MFLFFKKTHSLKIKYKDCKENKPAKLFAMSFVIKLKNRTFSGPKSFKKMSLDFFFFKLGHISL